MKINIIGITASWCDKCKQAKEYLKDYDIHWIDHEDMEDAEDFNFADFILEFYGVESIPFFMVIEEEEGDGVFRGHPIKSMLKVKRFCERLGLTV